MRGSVIPIVLAGLALAACHRDTMSDEQFNRIAVENGGQEQPPPPPNSVQGFANAIASMNKYEVALSQIADINSSADPATKDYARAMLESHKASMEKLRIALARLNPPPMADAQLSTDEEAGLENLRPRRGAEFDAAFKVMQVQAHEKAIRALEDYIAKGENEAMIGFARTALGTEQTHLTMAQSLH